MRLQRWIGLFAIGVLLGMVPCMFITSENVSVSQIVYALGFGGAAFGTSGLIEFTLAWFPILFFQVWLGNYIYEHYCVSSVYFFSRCTKRAKWYLKEVGKLYLMALVYVSLMMIGAYLVGRFRVTGQLIWDEAAGLLLCYYISIYSFWLFATTLLINVIGMVWDSSQGFILVVGTQMFCTALYAVLGDWFNFAEYTGEGMEEQILLLKLIPVSNLVLKWHSNYILDTPVIEGVLGFEYEFITSVIGLLFAACVVVVAGVYVVKRSDFLDNGRVM